MRVCTRCPPYPQDIPYIRDINTVTAQARICAVKNCERVASIDGNQRDQDSLRSVFTSSLAHDDR